MKLSCLFLLLLLLLGCQKPGEASGCNLKNVQVRSDDASLNVSYSAQSKLFSVKFNNENAPNAADNFPDPLVSIVNLKTEAVCEITDANGIWSGKSVYMDTTNNALLLNEYSGASDTLIIYDMRTCKRLDEIDVSGGRWEASADYIHVGQDCAGDAVNSCRHSRKIQLNSECKVER
jgi:hypothetical protein